MLNAEKKRMLAEATSKLKVGGGPSDANVVASVDAPVAVISAPNPSTPAPLNFRQKGVVEVVASKNENTNFGLIFKRNRGVDVTVPALPVSDGCAPSFREPPSASSPRDLVCLLYTSDAADE